MNPKFETTNPSGLRLRGRIWEAEGEPRAVVGLIHGLGEHIGRYDHVAEVLNKAGFSMIGTDLQWHGQSDGKRGHVPDFGNLLDDVFQTLERARVTFPGKPLFLYGHSLGGLMALYYVLKHKPDLAGVVATAPLLRLAHEPPIWQQKLLRGLRALNIHQSIPNGIDDTKLSRDINVVRAYRNDPLTHRQITPPLALGMLEAGEWCMAHANEFPIPLLLMHGDADQITSFKATEEFANLSPDRCTLKILPGVYHEPHNDPEKRDVLATITDWLNECLTI